MARGLIANVVSDRDGAELPTETTGDAVNNHFFRNSGKTKLFVRNSGVTGRLVTIYVERKVAGQSVTPITKTIAAGKTEVFGPYAVNDFGAMVNVDVAHAELLLRTVD